MIKVDIPLVSVDEKNRPVIDLAENLASGDWIRANRLKKKGDTKKFKRMENTEGFRLVEEDKE